MLPDPTFSFAAQRIPAGTTPKQYLGPYYPDTRVCSATQFDANRCGLAAPIATLPANTIRARKRTGRSAGKHGLKRRASRHHRPNCAKKRGRRCRGH
jgi:hypothetical protein